MLSITLDPETERRLEEVAARSGKSTRELAREAIRGYLEEIEDAALAVERLESPARRWTLEELERGLDVDG